MRFITRRLIPLVLLSAMVAGAAYVRSEGFTQKWRVYLTEKFEKNGLFISLDRLTLDPLEGLVARGVNIYQDKEHKLVLMEADHLTLDFDYSKMLRKEVFIEGMDLRQVKLSLPLDPEDPASERITLDGLNTRLYLVGDRIEIRKAEAELYGLQINITGSLLKPQPPVGPKDEKKERDQRRKTYAAIRARRDIIMETGKILKRFESPKAPQLDITINGDLNNPQNIDATLRLSAKKLKHGTYVCDELEVEATYTGEMAELTRLWAKDHLGELELGAIWQLGGTHVNFHLHSSADLPGLAAAISEKDIFREVVFYEPVNVTIDGKYLLGKENTTEAILPLDCIGNISAGRFTSRGEVFEGLSGNFGLSPQGYYLRDVLLKHGTGTLGAQVLWKKGEDFRFRMLLQMDPSVALPFMPPSKNTELLQRFKFRENSGIYVTFEGEGPEPDLNLCRNNGRIELHHFRYRGVEFEGINTRFEIQGKKGIFKGIELTRSEGLATAKEVVIDDDTHTVRLNDVVSDLEPVALMSVFAPNISQIIAKYRFDKNPHVEVSGLIYVRQPASDLKVKFRSEGTAHYTLWGDDYTVSQPKGELTFKGPLLSYDVNGQLFSRNMTCRGTANLSPEVDDYTVVFRGGSFPYPVFGKPLPFEQVTADVICKKGVAECAVTAKVFDGTVSFKGTVNGTRKPQTYKGDIRMNALSFMKFARVYSPKNETEGDLTGDFKFSVSMGDWKTLNGNGALVILNSNLYAVPILGPLTPLLGALLPKPIKGYNIAKEANCTFSVADGFVSTNDFEALTIVFRLETKGKIDFIEDRIQMEAKAKFRGLPGLVLFPVSEILEYVGEGSVGNPLWRPRLFSTTKEKTEFRKQDEIAPAAPPENEPKKEGLLPRILKPILPFKK
ncbi:MAG: hypothetical protein RL693_2016 [Verrucomicrobiota bacterium]|jgi:hypothetical protein